MARIDPAEETALMRVLDDDDDDDDNAGAILPAVTRDAVICDNPASRVLIREKNESIYA